MNARLLAFMRVIEIDMAFPLLIYFIMIEMTAFHEFAFFTSIVLVINCFLLSLIVSLPNEIGDEGDKRKNTTKHFFKVVCKVLNVALTVFAFIQIFISDHSFDIKEDLEIYFEMQDLLMNSTSYPIFNPSSTATGLPSATN